MNAELVENEREVEVTGEGSSAPTNMALISAISRAELDSQITTARAYPRSIKKFRDECRDMACLNETVARECYYVLPARRGGDGEPIEGPSVRLGEIVQSAWGNCQSGARIVDEGEKFVTAQGIFFDLERNVRVTMEVRRRITTKEGKRYGADMIGVTSAAACSIALRNAIFRGIPKAFWIEIYEEARRVAGGTEKSLAKNRADALAWLAGGNRKVPAEAVFAVLGVQGIEDIGLDELATLRGLVTAIKDGVATVAEAFAPPETKAPTSKKPTTAKPKGKAKGKPDAEQKPEPEKAATAKEGEKPEVKDVPRGDSDPKSLISAEQHSQLVAKIDAEGVPPNAVCAKYEIGVLTQLPAAWFDRAMAWVDGLSGKPS